MGKELSILYLRCKVIAYKFLYKLLFHLSILYLRCYVEQYPANIRSYTYPFNSLFEMRLPKRHCPRDERDGPFNSLFEMQPHAHLFAAGIDLYFQFSI